MAFQPLGTLGSILRGPDSIQVSRLIGGVIDSQTIVIGGGRQGIIRSANYVPSATGWMIDGTGFAEFTEMFTWTSFTPNLTASVTNPTLGSGSVQQGRYIQIGGLVIYRFLIQFGTSGTNAGDGQYRVELPVDAAVFTPSSIYTSMGQGVLFDWSVGGHKELCTWQWGAASYLTGVVKDATIFHNNPFTWTVDDRMGGTVSYEAADTTP